MATHLNAPTKQRAGSLRRLRNALGLLAACLTCSYVAVAAVVSMQRPEIGGGTIRIPVILAGQGDEALAGIQFDLAYDPAQYELVEVTGGAAAHDAGKEVILSQTASGSGRVLVIGFNDNALFDGHVATVVLRPLYPDTTTELFAMANILASDPDGYGVDIGYEDRYAFPPAPPEPAEAAGASEVPEKANDLDTAADASGLAESTAAGDSTAEAVGSTDRSPAADGGGALVPGGASDTGAAPIPAVPQARPGTRGPLLEAPSGPPQRIWEGGFGSPPDPSGRSGGDSRATDVPPRTGTLPRIPGGGGAAVEGRMDIAAATARTQDRTQPQVRLAFSAPAGTAITAAGALGDDVDGGTVGVTDPAVSRGTLGVAAVLGLVLFALLLGLRTLLHERLIRPHWRRET